MHNIYTFKGEDVSLIFIIKIADICNMISKETGESFKNVAPKFYASNTYKTMKDADNGLWLEPVGYIANEYLKEESIK